MSRLKRALRWLVYGDGVPYPWLDPEPVPERPRIVIDGEEVEGYELKPWQHGDGLRVTAAAHQRAVREQQRTQLPRLAAAMARHLQSKPVRYETTLKPGQTVQTGDGTLFRVEDVELVATVKFIGDTASPLLTMAVDAFEPWPEAPSKT